LDIYPKSSIQISVFFSGLKRISVPSNTPGMYMKRCFWSHSSLVSILDDVKHYCKVATAIEHTIHIQKSIDEIYNEAEKELIPEVFRRSE
jgi:hypothetical protein